VQAAKIVIPFIVFKAREKLKGNHDTLLCRAREACALGAGNFTMTAEELEMNSVFSPDMAGEEIAKIFKLWERKFEDRKKEGGTPLIIHAGPADLDEDELAMYQMIAPSLQGARVVFVEPHLFQRLQLEKRLREVHGHDRMSLDILGAAMCPHAEDGVSFFKISDRFFQDFKETGWLYLIRYWAGLRKEHLIRELQVFCNKTGNVWFFKDIRIFPETFPLTVDDWLPYIEEVRVRCHTPATLLEQIGARPEAVDVLLLDVEGYDVEIVNMFLELQGFAPTTIMFEWHLHGNDPAKLDALVNLARKLHARGYELHRHNHDVVAVSQ